MLDPDLALVLQYSHLKLLLTLSLIVALFAALFLLHRKYRQDRRILTPTGGLTLALLIWGALIIIRLAGAGVSWQLDHAYGLTRVSLVSHLHRYTASLLPELLMLLVLAGVFLHCRQQRIPFGLRLGLISALLASLLIFLQPVVLEPLQDTVRPIAEGQLKQDLEVLADQAGLPVPEIFIREESRWSPRSNARVSGMGSTLRVTLYDNLLKNFTQREVRAIVAHEYAHVALGHTAMAPLLISLLMIFGWLLAEFLFKEESERRGPPFHHSTEPGDVTSIILILVLVSFLFRIPALQISRLCEAEADRYAARLLQDTPALSAALTHLHRDNFSPPEHGKIFQFLFATHPTLLQRLEWLRLKPQ